MTIRNFINNLIDAVRIKRPWFPGLIRGGQGRLPKRIRKPRSGAPRHKRTGDSE